MNVVTLNSVSGRIILNDFEVARNIMRTSLAPAFEAQAALQKIIGMCCSSLESVAKPVRALLGIANGPKMASTEMDEAPRSSIVIPKPEFESVQIVEVTRHPLWSKDTARARNILVVKLPSPAFWEHIRIQFMNEFDVQIYYKRTFLGKYSHEALGLVRKNTKDKLPDKQWRLLQQLSVISSSRFAEPTIQHLSSSLNISANSCQQAKRKLANKLCTAFGIEESPFLEYLPGTGYQTKFQLSPEHLLRDDGDLRMQVRGNTENIASVDTDQQV